MSAATWAQNVSSEMSLKTHTGILRHTNSSLHRLPLPITFTFCLFPAPGLAVAADGVRLMVGKIPELWFCCPCFVSAVDVIWVCLSSPCALSTHLECLALAVSLGGVRRWDVLCPWHTDPACPAAVLTHLAFPAAFPRLPRNSCHLPAGHSHCKTEELKHWDISLPSSCAPHHIKIHPSVKAALAALVLFIFSLLCYMTSDAA